VSNNHKILHIFNKYSTRDLICDVNYFAISLEVAIRLK